jgi:5'(3')-deoxyribonucleotidase
LACSNADHGTNWTIDDIISYDINLIVGDHVYDYLELPGFYRNLDVLPDAVDVLAWASKRFDLVICTSRAAFAHEDTMAWVDEYLPMIDYENVVFARNKYLVDGDILIDDCPKHLEAWRGVPVVFGDLPYNRHLGSGPMIAAKDWVDARVLLESLLR